LIARRLKQTIQPNPVLFRFAVIGLTETQAVATVEAGYRRVAETTLIVRLGFSAWE
jgi:hypothetical protein